MNRIEACVMQEEYFGISGGSRISPMLPEICLHIRMGFTGASDRFLCYKHLQDTRDMLQARLDHWEESLPAEIHKQVDDAVKAMVSATITAIDNSIESDMAEDLPENPNPFIHYENPWWCGVCERKRKNGGES